MQSEFNFALVPYESLGPFRFDMNQGESLGQAMFGEFREARFKDGRYCRYFRQNDAMLRLEFDSEILTELEMEKGFRSLAYDGVDLLSFEDLTQFLKDKNLSVWTDEDIWICFDLGISYGHHSCKSICAFSRLKEPTYRNLLAEYNFQEV